MPVTPTSDTNVRDATEAFLAEQARRGRSETTLRDYRADLRALVRSVGASSPTKALAAATQRHLRGLRLADRSYNRHLSTVRRFCEYLVTVGALRANPLRDATSMVVHATDPVTVEGPALAQLIARIERPRDRALVMLLVGSGLRIGEALALKVKDVDPQRGIVIVRTGRARRCAMVPLATGSVMAYLRQRKAAAQDPLFATSTGQPLSYAAVHRLVRVYADGSGITMRHLRQSAVTAAFERGASLEDVQRMLGHRHAASTARYQVAHQTTLTRKEKHYGKTR